MSIQLDVPSWDDGDDGAGAAVIAPTKALRPATSFGSGGVGFGGFGGVGTRDPAAMRKEETKKKKKKKKGKEPKHADDADDGPASPSAVRPMSTSPGPATPAASTAADMAKPSSASKKRRGAELGQADGELEPKRPKKLKAKQKLARAARAAVAAAAAAGGTEAPTLGQKTLGEQLGTGSRFSPGSKGALELLQQQRRQLDKARKRKRVTSPMVVESLSSLQLQKSKPTPAEPAILAPQPQGDKKPKKHTQPKKQPAAAKSPAAKESRKQKQKNNRQTEALLKMEASASATAPKAAQQPAPQKKASKLSAAEKRLKGAKFRMLNERLYTTTGDAAFEMFSSSPDLFQVYHEGFQSQVDKWPANPVNKAIDWLKARPKSLVVADFGCGIAEVAQAVPNIVHSFDLVAHNEHIIACDIAHVPLENKSVDVALFSLALMGTNFLDYIAEAHRVLRKNGHLRIYEVVSRINVLDRFTAAVESIGFEFVSQGPPNTMFMELDFVKNKTQTAAPDHDAHGDALQPCIYKRR